MISQNGSFITTYVFRHFQNFSHILLPNISNWHEILQIEAVLPPIFSGEKFSSNVTRRLPLTSSHD